MNRYANFIDIQSAYNAVRYIQTQDRHTDSTVQLPLMVQTTTRNLEELHAPQGS